MVVVCCVSIDQRAGVGSGMISMPFNLPLKQDDEFSRAIVCAHADSTKRNLQKVISY